MAANMVPMTPRIHHNSAVFVGVTVPFVLLALVCVAARLSPRIRPAWRFGWDDGLIIVGLTLALILWGLLVGGVSYCAVNCPEAITLDELFNSVKLTTIAIPVWAIAVATVKLSAISMLMRFQSGTPWRIFLYIMGFIQIAFAVGNIIWLFGFMCRPFSATWSQNPADVAKCVPPSTTRTVSNVCTYINLATDLILSFIPVTFLINLKRSIQERVLLCILMAAALVASAASVGKMMEIRTFNAARAGDSQIASVSLISMWTALEPLLSIFAACLPCFKAFVQRLLVRMNIMSEPSGPRTLYLRDITVTSPVSATDTEKSEPIVKEVYDGLVDANGSGTSGPHREKSVG